MSWDGKPPEVIVPLVDINETAADHSDEEEGGKQLPAAVQGGGSVGGGGMLVSGLRSPGGGGSGGSVRPKTMKEYEDELMELRRDNFDLRMRIYLMEEQEENVAVAAATGSAVEQQAPTSTSTTTSSTGAATKPPLSFSQLRELYLTNSQLKEEISSLKNQLSEKDEMVVEAASAVRTLEKSQLEKLRQIKAEADIQCSRLTDTIQQLNQEVSELRESQAPLARVEKSNVFDDSNAMYAMAFNLPMPAAKSNTTETADRQATLLKVTTLELKLAELEREESARRLEMEEKLERIRTELKRSEDSRRLLSDELKHRECELGKAHRLIEEKCQSLVEYQDRMGLINLAKSGSDSTLAQKRSEGGCDASKCCSLSDFEEQLIRLREQLKTHKSENLRIQGENMKAMRTIQGLVKQNRALTRDLEQRKTIDSSQSTSTNAGTSGGGEEASLHTKDNRITELETEVGVLKDKLAAVSFSCEPHPSDLSLLRMELESKNAEIENLNEELKKRTFNLQELVNKELWDKNREIEKLNQVCERKQTELNSLKQELNIRNQDLIKLQEEFKKINSESFDIDESLLKNIEFKENKNPNLPMSIIIDEKLKNELRLSIEDNNKLKEEVEGLKNKLTDQTVICNSLKDDCQRWQLSAEESEKSRKELMNACTLLTTRLEELSTFLEHLLPLLGSRKRRMLQQAIDRSREMSRSFSFVDQSNLSLSIPLLPDVSQVDFCSGDETLTNMVDKASSENDEVARLRNQVECLVERLKKNETNPDGSRSGKMAGVWSLDEERLEDISEGSLLDSLSCGEVSTSLTPSRKQRAASLAIVARPAQPEPPQQQLLCMSESDGGWSEPDRNVSKQRIGITQMVSPTQKHSAVNSSEESARSNKKSPSGKKSRNEGLVELKRLSAKLDSLEQMNEALHAELQALHRSKTVRLEDNNVSLSKPNSPKSLRDLVNKRRRSLEKSLATDKPNPVEPNSKCGDVDELLSDRIKEMSVQLEKSCRRCLELEQRCFSLEGERQSLESRLTCADDKLKTLEMELERALGALKEKDTFLLEKQCALLEANNNNILLTAKFETITQNLNLKQDLIEKYEREMSEKEEKSKELYEELDELKKQSEEFESELKSRLECCQREAEEAVARRIEAERRLVESFELQTELKARLDQQLLSNKEMENHIKHEERGWRRRLSESEALRAERVADLRRKLDAAVLTTSEAVLERTRLANDKLKLQQDLRAKETTHISVMKELEKRVVELEALNSELEVEARCRWEVRQEPVGARSPTAIARSPTCPLSPTCPRSPNAITRSPTCPLSPTAIARSPTCPLSPSSPRSPPLSPRSPRPVAQRLLSNPQSSDYHSDQEHPYHVNSNFWLSSGRCNNNCSPDLGIESDHHSLATTACGKVPSLDPLPPPGSNGYVCKLEAENKNLRDHLLSTRKALADTISRLTSSNQKKRQVERAICKQIHKTHHVLQKARVNFETNENHPPSQ